MMIKNYFVVLAFGAMFAINVFAGEAWHGDYVVKHLVVEGSDDKPLVSAHMIPYPDTNCSDNGFVQLDTSTEKGKQIYSLLMMASATQKKVKAYLRDCTGREGIRPRIVHIWSLE